MPKQNKYLELHRIERKMYEDMSHEDLVDLTIKKAAEIRELREEIQILKQFVTWKT